MIPVSRSGPLSIARLVESFIWEIFSIRECQLPAISSREPRPRVERPHPYLSVPLTRLSFGAQLDEAEQHLVALCLQLLDGPRSDFGMNAIDELLLHFRRQLRRAQFLPPSRHRAGEL